MQKILFLLLVIAVIQFELIFNGLYHEPNWVKAWDRNGNEVELVSEWERVDGTYYWNIFDKLNNLITFLNF